MSFVELESLAVSLPPQYSGWRNRFPTATGLLTPAGWQRYHHKSNVPHVDLMSNKA